MFVLPNGVDKARLNDVEWTGDTHIPSTVLFTTHPHSLWTCDFQSLRLTAHKYATFLVN